MQPRNRFISVKWLLTTLLMLAACAVMIRLGIWQLDRLDQRRVFNARVLAQKSADPLTLDSNTVSLDLYNMEYRVVFVSGVFDHANEVVLRNQVFQGRPGYRLLTPLQITGTNYAIVVDRGFIPDDQYIQGQSNLFSTEGRVALTGILRRSQMAPEIGSRNDPTPLPGEKLLVWNLANLEAIGDQLPYAILDVYVQLTPFETNSELPVEYPAPYVNEIELTEGPHLGYAIQWFIFATILAIGYPFFIRRELQSEENGNK